MPFKIYSAIYLLLGVCFAGCERAVEAADDTPAPSATVADALLWQQPQVVATGAAEVGPWRMNDSEFHYVDDGSASIRDDGELAVVWADNQRQDVFLQRYNRQNTAQLERPVNVSSSPEIFSWLPQVIFTEDNQVYVLWQEIIFSGGSHGGEIFFARSDDGGETFSPPLNLSQTENGAGKGRLSEDRWDNGSFDFTLAPNGEIFVVWTEYQGRLRLSRSLDGGRSFNDAVTIAGSNEQPARAPSIAANADGNVYLSWAVGETDTADIHFARSTDKGETFEPTQVVHRSRDHSDIPSLAVDAQGYLHLLFSEGSTTAQQSSVYYVKLDQHGETQAAPRLISVVQTAEAPTIAVDSRGYLYGVWEHYPPDNHRARGLAFVVSADGGQTFSQPEIVPGSAGHEQAFNGSLQGQLGRKLTAHGHGDVVVTNSQLHRGEQSRVVFIRGRAEAPD